MFCRGKCWWHSPQWPLQTCHLLFVGTVRHLEAQGLSGWKYETWKILISALRQDEDHIIICILHYIADIAERGVGAYPLGISPTTLMLYWFLRSQKWVMIVAAMTCWRKKHHDLDKPDYWRGGHVTAEDLPLWALLGWAKAASFCSRHWALWPRWEQWVPRHWQWPPALESWAKAEKDPVKSDKEWQRKV